MPMLCAVKNCISGEVNRKNTSFFRIPKIKTGPSRALSIERRKLWLDAINKRDLNEKYARVCARHFISKKSASLKDQNNPDWVPSLNLGYKPETMQQSAQMELSEKPLESTYTLEIEILANTSNEMQTQQLEIELDAASNSSETTIESLPAYICISTGTQTDQLPANTSAETLKIKYYEDIIADLKLKNEILVAEHAKEIDEKNSQIKNLKQKLNGYTMNIDY